MKPIINSTIYFRLNTGRANTAVHVQEMADALLSGATQLEKESEKPFIGPMQPVNLSDISKTDCAEAVASSGDSEMHHETQVESQTVQAGKESGLCSYFELIVKNCDLPGLYLCLS